MNKQTFKRLQIISKLKEMIAKKPDLDVKNLKLWVCQNHQVSMRTASEYIRIAGG